MNTYFVCATQPSNLGDLVINKVLIDEMCKYGSVYLDAYNLPDSFKKPLLEKPNVIDVSQLGFSVKRPSLSGYVRFRRLIRGNNVGVVTKSPGPLSTYPLLLRIAFSLINIVGRLGGAKSVYIGNCCSANYSTNKSVKNLCTDIVFLRSLESVEYARKYLTCPVEYIPDLAFLLQPSTSPFQKKKKIALDFRIVESEEGIVFKDVKEIVCRFLQRGFDVEIYYQVKGDKPAAEKLYKLLRECGVTFHDDLVWYDSLDYYADKAYIISNRLHSLLFGAIYGALPIARITNNAKLSKINHVFGSALPKEFSKSIYVDIPLDLDTIIENENAYRKLLNESISRNRNICESIIKEICIQS